MSSKRKLKRRNPAPVAGFKYERMCQAVSEQAIYLSRAGCCYRHPLERLRRLAAQRPTSEILCRDIPRTSGSCRQGVYAVAAGSYG